MDHHSITVYNNYSVLSVFININIKKLMDKLLFCPVTSFNHTKKFLLKFVCKILIPMSNIFPDLLKYNHKMLTNYYYNLLYTNFY